MSNTIRVFVPVGNVQAPGTRDAVAARRRSGPHLVVGMLDNHKHNSDKVLDRLQQRLSERYGLVGCISGRRAEDARQLVGLDAQPFHLLDRPDPDVGFGRL